MEEILLSLSLSTLLNEKENPVSFSRFFLHKHFLSFTFYFIFFLAESENEEEEGLPIGCDSGDLNMSDHYVDLEGGRVPTNQILRDFYQTEKLDIKDKVKVS